MSPTPPPVRISHAGFVRFAALPLRVVVGYGFLAHGLAKWTKGPVAFGRFFTPQVCLRRNLWRGPRSLLRFSAALHSYWERLSPL